MIEQLSINTIRTLSIDAIERAQSGHPGLPMGAAPMAYTLFTKFMRHNPKNSKWFNRDRFILSAGHGSMLLYSLLHLCGYNITIDDLKNFRKLDSNTPGHPEVLDTDGVEATTGPLGQGLGMAVGMAMAEAHLAAKYNKPNLEIIDHYTYCLVGDGDIMEGVSHEAASLAGHLGLSKLIVLYDSNDISLDGDLNLAFSDDTKLRFEAYGWQVLEVSDGNDIIEIEQAIQEAQNNTSQPTLIEVKTIIGYGSPNKSDSSKAHGSPLGAEEVKLTKDYYNWRYQEEFYVPKEVYEDFDLKVLRKGEDAERVWLQSLSQYKRRYPDLWNELILLMQNKLPLDWNNNLPKYKVGKDYLASRAASGETLNILSKKISNLIGGSADLASSNNTLLKDEKNFSKFDYSGRNIWFGVREFAMGTILNGLALHGGLKVYGGTFFVFSDYLRPAIRLAALQNLPIIYIFTHDSIAVGEDGPTHEPIEQLSSLRAMPNVSVIRPADGNETVAAWQLAVQSEGTPTALILTRQNLPTLITPDQESYNNVKRGAYIIKKENERIDAILIASGSEVDLALKAQLRLSELGLDVRVVSMPSWDYFEKQSMSYRNSVLPDNIDHRIAIEMAASLGWERYVGRKGKIIGIDQFGASAKGEELMHKYGFTVDNIIAEVLKLCHKKRD